VDILGWSKLNIGLLELRGFGPFAFFFFFPLVPVPVLELYLDMNMMNME